MDILIALMVLGLAYLLIVTFKISLWTLLVVLAVVALVVVIYRNVSPRPWR